MPSKTAFRRARRKVAKFAIIGLACLIALFLARRMGLIRSGPPAAGGGAIAFAVEPTATAPSAAKNETASRAAFTEAYKVFMHARCMNCHPAGDSPLQGDDSHVHAQNVQRGPDGRGRYALKCTNCHQRDNVSGANMPPGAADWELPMPQTPMVFQGRTPAQLCKQLKDKSQNGGRDLEAVIHHLDSDLVRWAWNPGEGRTKPPLSHEEFVRKMREWVDQGAACPE